MRQSVWTVLKDVIFFIDFAIFDLSNFCPDLLESVDEAIKLELVLRLSRLDHKSTNYRPAHGWGVETIVH